MSEYYTADVKVNGTSIYENQEVLVIYQRLGVWIEDAGTVADGVIQITYPLDENQPYWFGRRYASELETFPIRGQGKINAKSRVSEVSVFLERSQGGSVTLVNERGEERESDIAYDSSALFTGKREIKMNSGYAEEISVRIRADGYDPFNLLALDVAFSQTER